MIVDSRGPGPREKTVPVAERSLARPLAVPVQRRQGKGEKERSVDWDRRLARARRLGPGAPWLLPAQQQIQRTLVQRALINANTFDTPEEVERELEDFRYLRVYLEIRNLVEGYNKELETETGDVVRHLQLLDLIEEKVGGCRSLIRKEAKLGERPVFRRIVQLYELVVSIKEERANVLASKTEQKEILAGPQAELPSGVAWDFWNENKEEWRDASSLLKENEKLPVTITDRLQGKYYFTFQIGANTEKGRADKGSLTLGTRFTRDDSALYPNGIPKPEDVRQTNLGDCYLQAALAGLAAQDPSYIMNKMIYDAGDRVVVRLYKLPENKARFINVERSKAQTTSGVDLYNAGAMWVKMVQKAYAASGFASSLGSNPRKNISIKDISGDMVGYLMGVLTGRDLESFAASGEDLQEPIKEMTPTPWSFDVGTLWLFLQQSRSPSWWNQRKAYREYHAALKLLKKIFGKNMPSIRRWAKFADENRDELDDFKSIEEFKKFFTDESLNGGVAREVMGWVKRSGFFMGEVGSGKYSIGQLKMFDKVEEALSLHKLVAVGTKKKLTRGLGEGTGSAGEQKYKGLAGGHAYSVLDCRRNRTANPNSSTKGDIFWIQLRNPWGKYGRAYDEQWRPKAIDEGGGIFWIELTDLARNFGDIEII